MTTSLPAEVACMKMAGPDVWIINPYGTLPSEGWRSTRGVLLAKTLVEAGYRVTWFTSSFGHILKRYRTAPGHESEQLGIQFRLVRATRYRHNISVRRLVSEAVFALRLVISARRMQTPPDIIIAGHATAFAGAASVYLAHRYKAPLVIDMFDLWPEAYTVAIPRRLRRLAPVLLSPFLLLRRLIFRRADALIALARKNLDVAIEAAGRDRNDRCVLVYEGADLAARPAAADVGEVPSRPHGSQPASTAIRIVYAGSLGQGCDIETIVKAAEILARSGTPAEIVIAGDGPKRGYLESVLSQCDCANIRYVGALSQADLHGLYRGSAIGLCSYLADSTVEMPCKFYDYVAEGLAVVSSVRGELAAVIAEARLGLQYEAQSPESLAEAIAGLVASPAMLDTFRRNAGCAAASFDRPVQYGKAVRLIDDLLRERGRPPDGSRVGTRRAGVLPPSLERKPAAVVLISPFDALPGDAFRPGRFADFSGALARRKHRVIWIGSTFNHRAKARRSAQPPDEVGVTVLLVPSLAYRFNICIRREVSHIVFAIMAAWKLLPLLWKGGVESVVCSFPPILAPVFCGILAKLFRVPFVLDVHDAWPDAFEIFLPRRLPVSLVFTAGTLLRSFAGKLSCGATLVSADYKAYFGSAMPAKTIVTPLGHPFGKFWQHYAPDWNLVPKKAGDYWVTYVGTVSQNYALDVVLAGLADLPGNVKFVVAGSGLAVQSLSDRALAIGFQNLVLTGELSHSDLANLLARSDLALVPVDVRTHIRMPKKVFDYLAAGLPILTNIRGGELEEIVLSSGIGALYDPGSIDSLRAGVRACQQLDREAVRARALRLAEDRFDTAALADEFVRWLEDNIHDTGSSDLVGSGAHEAGV